MPRQFNDMGLDVLTAVEVGSSKISCFVVQTGNLYTGKRDDNARVIGIGHHLSPGVKGGSIIDMKATESAIRASVEAAERMAKVTVHDVVVNVSCGRPRSELIRVRTPVRGQIGGSDIKEVLNEVRTYQSAPDRTVIHTVPCDFVVGGCGGIRDPRGMVAAELAGTVHVVSVESAALSNLIACVERCHLEVFGLTLSSYASGLSCLTDDEKELGVICVDLGGGTTSLGIFYGGAFVHCDIIPVGGSHITNDIAYGLSTTITHAERIKVLYGCVLTDVDDNRDIVDFLTVSDEQEGDAERIPRSVLTGIIRPRVKEILEIVRDRIKTSGFSHLTSKQIVLTGGGSQLLGLRNLATQILGCQVRIGRPMGVEGLADATEGPAFSACVGLLSYARQVGGYSDSISAFGYPSAGLRGQFAHISQWLKENF
ncbi:MAG: cell division protein FtsA [Parvularculales bacterium]